ncbi:sugar-binding transcriptional regulator [Labedella endophytica]|uniref:DeoR family transcriptional regulator n=1 Tax=Labedella endophytica TaxID=1523160 RepID=A0A3S1CQ21_9MICO|nr:sugar-binding domain-containing protein [Labedella endophytica]RUQ98229.1 DeoR family transcriptional regulator [Labedella endophytica]
MLRVARSYFLDDVSKVTIAQREGLSRWQVARILDDARRVGLVRITVGDPSDTDRTLSDAVSAALGVSETIVVGRSRRLGLEPSLDSIGSALAQFLARTVREGDAIGLTWSRAIEAMVTHLAELEPCDVVQLAGAVTLTGDRLGSVEIIRQVARLSRGTAYPIYAPIVVDSAATRRSLEEQPEIASCLDRASRLDLAVVSVGTWSSDGSALYGLVPAALAGDIARAGAVGEITGRVFGADGRLVSSAFDERVIGISAAQLRAVPHIVATSYGPHRADATIAAARAGYITTLIIDAPLAEAILDRLDERQAPGRQSTERRRSTDPRGE